MHVHALYRYPVKGLNGQSLPALHPAPRGFRDDRRWMFVDATGHFYSQRGNRQLARFRAEVMGEEGLRFVRVADGAVVGEVAAARPTAPPDAGVTVWDDRFGATVVPLPDARLTAALGLPPDTRLVYMAADSHRPVDPRYATRPDEEVSFADGYPYLFTTRASLAALAARLGRDDLDERRFRPNVVLADTGAPFAEDHWRALRIGAHDFALVKPCARCTVITHDPDTGAADPTVLRTLTDFRRVGNKVLFGMNAVWRGGHATPLRVGHRVTAQEAIGTSAAR